ncbi:hypothetical protein QFC20_004040 [Naganishia adeliensis]|uniref:Uncharacterized protein n=1 Tax=Naganishia adeliensis TaxID=92952 RepID=A0ACC2W553_9TREE|nr:hypothetical protein QFC20_004040 [Naganishia adeliensis]
MAPTEYNRGRGGSRGARGGRGGRGGSGAGRGRGGFKVGPAHAPSNAYLGKAKKIKEDLINRARIKKSYAKTLKKEGLSSERLGSAGNATALGARAKPYGTGFEEGDVLEIDDASSGDDESDEGDSEGDDYEEDADRGWRRRSSERVTRDIPTLARLAANQQPRSRNHRPSSWDRTEPRADHTTPEGPSLRELKRQAYLGPPVDAQRIAAHPSRSRKVLKQPVPPQDEGKTGGLRKPVSTGDGKVQTGGGRAPVGGYAGAGARRRDGRPNLNARMGVLLEQIQRSK